jgi:hypothetical protein
VAFVTPVAQAPGWRMGCILSPMSPPESTVHYTHPVTRAVTTQREHSLQLKAADRITAFAGSMPFVYLHAALFALWMTVFERSPWPTLTCTTGSSPRAEADAATNGVRSRLCEAQAQAGGVALIPSVIH